MKRKKMVRNVDCIRCFSVWRNKHSHAQHNNTFASPNWCDWHTIYVTQAHHWTRPHTDCCVYIAWENKFDIDLTDIFASNSKSGIFSLLNLLWESKLRLRSETILWNARIKTDCLHRPKKESIRCKLDSVRYPNVLVAITMTEWIPYGIWHLTETTISNDIRDFGEKEVDWQMCVCTSCELWNINKNNN